jgi:hypothetical protein
LKLVPRVENQNGWSLLSRGAATGVTITPLLMTEPAGFGIGAAPGAGLAGMASAGAPMIWPLTPPPHPQDEPQVLQLSQQLFFWNLALRRSQSFTRGSSHPQLLPQVLQPQLTGAAWQQVGAGAGQQLFLTGAQQVGAGAQQDCCSHPQPQSFL